MTLWALITLGTWKDKSSIPFTGCAFPLEIPSLKRKTSCTHMYMDERLYTYICTYISTLKRICGKWNPKSERTFNFSFSTFYHNEMIVHSALQTIMDFSLDFLDIVCLLWSSKLFAFIRLIPFVDIFWNSFSIVVNKDGKFYTSDLISIQFEKKFSTKVALSTYSS